MNYIKKRILHILVRKMQNEYHLANYLAEIKTLNWIILINPIASNYALRANIYGVLKNFEKAINDDSTAIELQPNNYDYYRDRAYYYSKINQFQEAINDYNEAIKLKPNDDGLLLSRAQLYHDNEDYQNAILEYNKVIEINHQEIEAYIGKGICLDKQEQYADAIETYKAGIKVDQNTTELYDNLGIALARQNKHHESLTFFDKAIQIDSKNYYAFYNRAKTNFDLKEWILSLNDLNKTIELNPEFDDAYILRGNVFIELNDKESACKDFHFALDLGKIEVQENIDEYCK